MKNDFPWDIILPILVPLLIIGGTFFITTQLSSFDKNPTVEVVTVTIMGADWISWITSQDRPGIVARPTFKNKDSGKFKVDLQPGIYWLWSKGENPYYIKVEAGRDNIFDRRGVSPDSVFYSPEKE